MKAGTTTTRTCHGCGEDFDWIVKPGTRPIWCSERCRKRQYDRVCSRCGGRADGTSPGNTKTDMCAPCFKAVRHERAVNRIIAAIKLWDGRYGRPPSALDWNRGPSQRSSRHHEQQVELERRWSEGTWPHSADVVSVFGSWNVAIEAAGFDPLTNGKRRDPESWQHHLPRGADHYRARAAA